MNTDIRPALDVPGQLREAYAVCKALTRRHGTTYYWATRLLPASRRPHVYALYGFCRYADDIVDALDGSPVPARERALEDLAAELRYGLEHPSSVDPRGTPVVAAVVHTAQTYDIDPGCFDRFLGSMRMDLTVSSYPTWGDLCAYMDGSAAVIGEMMLPILEPLSTDARRPAQDLGLAFQLTNFLRDVGEDLERGRIYIPGEDLEQFGADPVRRTVDGAWRSLMQFEIARARQLYVSADRGITMLPAWSARAIGTARELYARILDEIEANDLDVFGSRARVPTATKVLVAARGFARRR